MPSNTLSLPATFLVLLGAIQSNAFVSPRSMSDRSFGCQIDQRCCHPHPTGPGPNQQQLERKEVHSLLACMATTRKDVYLPLLDLSDSEIAEKVIVPLPSSHLPDELTTLNLYGMELSRPIHKMLIQEAIQKGTDLQSEERPKQRAFGYLVHKSNPDSLVGAVGCAAEVLIQAARQDVPPDASERGQDPPIAVLYRGCYRFQVKQIVRSIPYPVVLVDELVDDFHGDNSTLSRLIQSDDEDYDDHNLEDYINLSVRELNQRIMQASKTLVVQRLQEVANQPDVSPLERSILESATLFTLDQASQEEQAEEAAAVFDVFSSSLLDFAPSRKEQMYAIAMMAAELASFDNEIRRKIIATTDSLWRLQLVCKHIEDIIRMKHARKVASQIIEEKDESSKDLKVGPPTLPPWANQIRKGTRVEYYWNDEWEWSPGEVIADPVKIMDELLIQIKFDADGEVHTLPLNPDEKLRWRPGRPKL